MPGKVSVKVFFLFGFKKANKISFQQANSLLPNERKDGQLMTSVSAPVFDRRNYSVCISEISDNVQSVKPVILRSISGIINNRSSEKLILEFCQ